MQIAILAGGLGTRLSEETVVRPKPMVEIGGRPILWHILAHFAHFGFEESFIALGYKGEYIKRFFLEHADAVGSMSINFADGTIERHERPEEDWNVHLVDTGASTNTGGRVRRLRNWLSNDTFLLTYGDGVADVDLDELIKFHRKKGRMVTLTAVRPPARFGGLIFNGENVTGFEEKPQIGEGWINGGFMVCEPQIFDYLSSDEDSLESVALEQLAAERALAAYRHLGFWQCMDTLRDKRQLEELWQTGNAPWQHQNSHHKKNSLRMVA